MKKNFKKKLLSGTALLLTSIVLLASGGSVIAVALFGGLGLSFIPTSLKLKNTNKEKILRNHITTFVENPNYAKDKPKIEYELDELNLTEQEINLLNQHHTEFKINKPIQPLEENGKIQTIDLLPKLETIDALTEKENINRLIRKREKTDKLKRNNL